MYLSTPGFNPLYRKEKGREGGKEINKPALFQNFYLFLAHLYDSKNGSFICISACLQHIMIAFIMESRYMYIMLGEKEKKTKA